MRGSRHPVPDPTTSKVVLHLIFLPTTLYDSRIPQRLSSLYKFILAFALHDRNTLLLLGSTCLRLITRDDSISALQIDLARPLRRLDTSLDPAQRVSR